MSDESRKKILARRASFVAAALASVACGKDAAERPEPCLSVPYHHDPDAEPPRPCLSVAIPDPSAPVPDAGAGGPDASAKAVMDGGVRPPTPHPCLKPRLP